MPESESESQPSLCAQAAQAHNARSFFFFNLYTNVQRAKRDTVTADIYYYITTEFGYAKRDLRLAVCGGVVLQRFEFIKVCMGKNGNRHYSLNFGIFAIKMTHLNALLSFLLSSSFSARSEAF